MRRASLPHQQDGEWWFVSPWSGSLFRSTQTPSSAASRNISKKVHEALAFCDNPYLCSWSPDFYQHHSDSRQNCRLNRLARLLVFMGNERFFVATAVAGCGFALFDTTHQAFAAISRLPGLSWADDNCLQRSLLAAMTSKSFGRQGVLFIGAELSTGEMHAWIIENGEQPDPEDRSWINFRPLLALYK